MEALKLLRIILKLAVKFDKLDKLFAVFVLLFKSVKFVVVLIDTIVVFCKVVLATAGDGGDGAGVTITL